LLDRVDACVLPRRSSSTRALVLRGLGSPAREAAADHAAPVHSGLASTRASLIACTSMTAFVWT
jgi:hypothetical protein